MPKHKNLIGPRFETVAEVKLDPAIYPQFLTTEEFAAVVRNTPEGVRYWRHVGKGPKSFRAGRRVLYAREDVEARLHEQMQEVSAA